MPFREDGAAAPAAYNPQRGAKVIAFVRDFLDEHFALADGSHRDAVRYRLSAVAGLRGSS